MGHSEDDAVIKRPHLNENAWAEAAENFDEVYFLVLYTIEQKGRCHTCPMSLYVTKLLSKRIMCINKQSQTFSTCKTSGQRDHLALHLFPKVCVSSEHLISLMRNYLLASQD